MLEGFWQLDLEQRVRALHSALPQYDEAAIRRLVQRLHDFQLVPPDEDARAAGRSLVAKALDSGAVNAGQRDPLGSMGLSETPVSSTNTWSLYEDWSMVADADKVQESGDDLQYQHLFGQRRNEPVLTGIAISFVHAMIAGPDSRRTFHNSDIVPTSTLRSNEKVLKGGAYVEPPSLYVHATEYEPTTFAPHLDNPLCAAHITQGCLGAHTLGAYCERTGTPCLRAPDAFYELFGMTRSRVELTTAERTSWGFHVLGGMKLRIKRHSN